MTRVQQIRQLDVHGAYFCVYDRSPRSVCFPPSLLRCKVVLVGGQEELLGGTTLETEVALVALQLLLQAP
jgi:hypothetical protein